MIDKDEYPQTAAIEDALLDDARRPLERARHPTGAIGTSTIGSSEACMLGGLALKRRWQQRPPGRGQVDRDART